MDNNETMRRLRWALSLDDADAARLTRAGGLDATPADAAAWRTRDEDPDRIECPDPAVAALLDGLVLERRGPRDGDAGDVRGGDDTAAAASGVAPPTPATVRVDNNLVLKALRIALELRTEDVARLVGLTVPETASLFRKRGTRNFRRCGDQVLRRFLDGLAARERDVPAGAPGPALERAPEGGARDVRVDET